MSDCCKETQCSSCIHLDICSVKVKFLDAQRAVDELIVYSDLPGGKQGMVKLHDIGFIKPVELRCIHYLPKKTFAVR